MVLFQKEPAGMRYLEVLQEGFGFLRSANFLTGQQDVYVAPSQIRRFGLRTGDMVDGFQKANPDDNKYDALILHQYNQWC